MYKIYDNGLLEEFWAGCMSEAHNSERKENSNEGMKQQADGASMVPVKVGMFYYAEENLFSFQLFPDKVVSGVVGYVDDSGQHGIIVTLHQKIMQWSRDYFFVEVDEKNGVENTSLILKIARKMRCNVDAIQYCIAYVLDGIKSETAFLPSLKELEEIRVHVDCINEALRKIKHADLLDDVYYYTSTTRSNGGAVRINPISGDVKFDVKNYLGYGVRPCVAF